MTDQFKELQNKMQQAQQALQKLIITCEAGEGMVSVTVNGNRKVLKIEIDESIIPAKESAILTELIIIATNKAIDEANIQARQELKEKANGYLPNMNKSNS